MAMADIDISARAAGAAMAQRGATILGTIATAVVFMLSLTAAAGIVPTSKLGWDAVADD
jgi:hypothetical protein